MSQHGRTEPAGSYGLVAFLQGNSIKIVNLGQAKKAVPRIANG